MSGESHHDLLDKGHTIFIGGEWSSGAGAFDVTDPAAPAEITARLATGRPEDIDAAYAAAEAAGSEWGRSTAQYRSGILLAAADLLEAHLDEATERLTLDMGKAHRDARAEVSRGVAILRYFAGDVLQASGEVYPSADPETTLMTIEEPVGTVAVITPWNFPVAIPLWKIAPALVYGNTVVWKPASAAAGSAVLLAGILGRAGLPDGVLNLVTGSGGELSEAITSASGMRALSFTGSGATGMKIQAALSGTTAKLQLELGGKNPAIVLADADLADAAVQISRGAFLSTGQRCTATSRAYVERAVFDHFSDLLRAEAAAMVVADPQDPGTDVGPAASAAQFRTVNEYLDLARAEGATFLFGEDRVPAADGGYFIPPTILTGVDLESRLVTEEIFGPVICLIPVDGFEQGIELANDTEFGLSSAVFTSDLKVAMKFARLTESGVVHVNRETAGVEPHVPFGGLKGSSNAQREQGTAARRFFTNTKTVYIRTP
ncbi:MAG TPA: aldehyde dehydrogenase family protein [Solirubrobacterales bacterium]|nr:aldehyde dehydrogenase family protein [Solirubrobacterales bacterium]